MQASIVKKFSNIKTWLFVPATRIDRVKKAFASGTDAVIVDLEDAVAEANKVQARKDLQVYYNSQDYQPIWVRINKAGSEEFFKDVVLCQQMPNLAGVLLAKAEQASDIENAHNMTGLPVIALIETALGLYQIDSMAKS
ncbi:aldolase/citrate lyase family protein, partial [Psychrobacter sp. 16-Bac2893]